VSAHFASVLSILSAKQKVSAKLKDATIGYIVWDEKLPDQLQMIDVPPQAKVKKGDSVFTTNFSFFPPDILVGTVMRITILKKNNFQKLYLQPSTNFRNLQYVYVVENKMSEEKKRLEDSTVKK
jgi:rod shape-determining protein MreC